MCCPTASAPTRGRRLVAISIKTDESFSKNDGFCSKNDEFCIKIEDGAAAMWNRVARWAWARHYPSAVFLPAMDILSIDWHSYSVGLLLVWGCGGLGGGLSFNFSPRVCSAKPSFCINAVGDDGSCESNRSTTLFCLVQRSSDHVAWAGLVRLIGNKSIDLNAKPTILNTKSIKIWMQNPSFWIQNPSNLNAKPTILNTKSIKFECKTHHFEYKIHQNLNAKPTILNTKSIKFECKTHHFEYKIHHL